MHRDTIDRLLLALIVATLAASALIAWRAPDYFQFTFAAEDRLVENGTALFLLVASLVLLSNAARLAGRGARRAAVLTSLYALLFFLAAGEEISWGQRVFNWETGDFFAEHNYQGETNLHNLMVGEVRLARVLFGSVLTTVLLIYLVVLPLLYPRMAWLRRCRDCGTGFWRCWRAAWSRPSTCRATGRSTSWSLPCSPPRSSSRRRTRTRPAERACPTGAAATARALPFSRSPARRKSRSRRAHGWPRVRSRARNRRSSPSTGRQARCAPRSWRAARNAGWALRPPAECT